MNSANGEPQSDNQPEGADAAGRPAWVSDELFPFTSRFLEIDGHRLHYVDEGPRSDRPTLLMLHGNPTWSFLFRHLISGLSGDIRCVAVDYPGFGLSAAAAGYGFRPEEHARVVESFVDRLGLASYVPVVGDWGGPIGLWVAGRRPDRVAGLVIGNTFAWPVTGDRHFEVFSALLGGPLGRLAIRYGNVFVTRVMPRLHVRSRLTDAEMEHYRRPFATRDSRRPTSVFPRCITSSAQFLAEVEQGLQRLSETPALIVWGDRDPAFRPSERERFERVLSDHTTIELPGAGHYLPEEAPDEIVAAIRRWPGVSASP